VTFTLTDAIIVIVIEFWYFSVVTAMLYTSIGIGIARGQYYWTLGAFLGIVLTLPDMTEPWAFLKSITQTR